MKKLFHALNTLAGLLLTTLGCSVAQAGSSPIDGKVWTQTDKIEYYFADSSTPPDYHRSYSLTVTKTEARIVVDSYGTTLLDKTYKLKKGQWAKAVEALKKLDIQSKKKGKAAPCSGGTTESFYLYAGSESLFRGYLDNCADELSTMVVGSEIIPRVLGFLFPKPVEELVNETRVQ